MLIETVTEKMTSVAHNSTVTHEDAIHDRGLVSPSRYAWRQASRVPQNSPPAILPPLWDSCDSSSNVEILKMRLVEARRRAQQQICAQL